MLAIVCALQAAPAHAMRPFNGTDASTAEPGAFELELGPAGYLHSGLQRTLIAPAVVANFGFSGDTEVVIEGGLNRPIGDDGRRTSFSDGALSVKHVFRRGSVQDGGTGVSIAAECGALLHDIHGSSGTGATCAAIFSQHFSAMRMHLNTALTRTREGANDRLLGLIVEGTESVRPVMEVFEARDNRGGRVHSALLGMVWQREENLAFDVGMRRAREDGVTVTELRMGLTWSVGMP
jgi:hypothetical protein